MNKQALVRIIDVPKVVFPGVRVTTFGIICLDPNFEEISRLTVKNQGKNAVFMKEFGGPFCAAHSKEGLEKLLKQIRKAVKYFGALEDIVVSAHQECKVYNEKYLDRNKEEIIQIQIDDVLYLVGEILTFVREILKNDKIKVGGNIYLIDEETQIITPYIIVE